VLWISVPFWTPWALPVNRYDALRCYAELLVSAPVFYGTYIGRPGVHSRSCSDLLLWFFSEDTSCAIYVGTLVHSSWQLLCLRRRQAWPRPEIRTIGGTATTTSGITIETIVTITTGTTVKIALTGVTCCQNTAFTTSSTERAPERTETTGIGATVIPTETSECIIATGSGAFGSKPLHL
jgi:hypothetical protein